MCDTNITVTTITVTVTVTVTVSAVQTSVCVRGQSLVTGAEACMRLLRVQHMVHWDESTLSLRTVRPNKETGLPEVPPHHHYKFSCGIPQ